VIESIRVPEPGCKTPCVAHIVAAATDAIWSMQLVGRRLFVSNAWNVRVFHTDTWKRSTVWERSTLQQHVFDFCVDGSRLALAGGDGSRLALAGGDGSRLALAGGDGTRTFVGLGGLRAPATP